MVVSLAVDAPCSGPVPFLVRLHAPVRRMTSAANGTDFWKGALCSMMTEPLAVETPQRFFVERLGGEGPPDSQIYSGWDFSREGGYYGCSWLACLA